MCDGGLMKKVGRLSPLNRMIIDKMPASPVSGIGLLRRGGGDKPADKGKVPTGV